MYYPGRNYRRVQVASDSLPCRGNPLDCVRFTSLILRYSESNLHEYLTLGRIFI